MITLTQGKLDQAKAEAKELLEYSIFVTAATLAVDLDEIDGSYTNPYAYEEGSNNELYYAHESLSRQIAALVALS